MSAGILHIVVTAIKYVKTHKEVICVFVLVDSSLKALESHAKVCEMANVGKSCLLLS